MTFGEAKGVLKDEGMISEDEYQKIVSETENLGKSQYGGGNKKIDEAIKESGATYGDGDLVEKLDSYFSEAHGAYSHVYERYATDSPEEYNAKIGTRPDASQSE